MAAATPNVVIVGSGFGGLEAAKGLRGAPVRVTVIDKANHHLFQPLLYQVATAALAPTNIAAPIRDVLHRQKNAEVFLATVTRVDTKSRQVVLSNGAALTYDYLVLATGSNYSYFGHPEWEADAPSLKTLADAVTIRQRILLAFETAEMESNPDRRRSLLTFVLVGGGPTGVELAGSIAELARRALRQDFRHTRPEEARVILLEAGPRILASFPEHLSSAAAGALRDLGVEVRTNSPASKIDSDGVEVKGERIESTTVLWTAGVKASPVGTWLGTDMDKSGRVLVKPDLSVIGIPEVFVVGDSAHVEQDGHPLPGVAPVAMQQGRYVARAIRARLAGRSHPSFHYHDKGNLATVGRAFAILDLGRIRLSGFIAWVLWVFIHIWYLIGFRTKLSVFSQWAYAYFTWQRSARLITGPIPAPTRNDGRPQAPLTPTHQDLPFPDAESRPLPLQENRKQPLS